MPASFSHSNNSKQREQIAEGCYAARCYGIAELGVHKREWQGEVKYGPEIIFFFEIPSETITYEKNGETVTAPRVINHRMKNSLHEKAKMRAFLNSWRGKPLTDDEAAKFNTDNIIGKTCQISIAHNAKGFANISSIAPLMKGINVEDQVNPTINFGIADLHNPEEFGKLYPWVQKMVMESEEAKHVNQEPVIQHEEDDIPF